MKKIKEYEEILADRKILLGVVRKEILEISDKYGDDRRTLIGFDEENISLEDLIPREDVVITMTKLGYIKRMTGDNFRSQNRGGKGIKGMQPIENDYIEELLMTTTHDYLMFFTSMGRVYRLKTYEIPEAGRTARGTAIVNLLQLQPGEKITSLIAISDFAQGKNLVMATRKGLVKKTPLSDYARVLKKGLGAIVLREDDELIEVKVTDNTREVMLVTKYGQCIRFKETDVRATGRMSMGVRGINLADGDEIVAMQLYNPDKYLLVASESGMGKRTLLSEFPIYNRGGKGVKCYKITEKTGELIGAKAVGEEDEVMLISTSGLIIRTRCAGISVNGRIASGVKLFNLKEGDSVAGLAIVKENRNKEDLDGIEGENIEG
jgi:DNA gyrase subunit A